MNTTTATQTFDQMTTDDRWFGFGYLGARHNALDTTDPECPAQPEMVEAADRLITEYATANKWSAEKLFQWANSKNGRYYGDAMFGGRGTADERFAQAVRWGVLRVVR